MLNFESDDLCENMVILLETLGFPVDIGPDNDKWIEGSSYYNGNSLVLKCEETIVQVDLQETIRFTFGNKFSLILYLGLNQEDHLCNPPWLRPDQTIYKLLVALHRSKNNPQRVHQLIREYRDSLTLQYKEWFGCFDVVCRDFWYRMNFPKPTLPTREPLWEGYDYEIHEIIDSEYCRLSNGVKYRLSDIQAFTLRPGTRVLVGTLDTHKIKTNEIDRLPWEFTIEDLLEGEGPELYDGCYNALNFPIILPPGPKKISQMVV